MLPVCKTNVYSFLLVHSCFVQKLRELRSMVFVSVLLGSFVVRVSYVQRYSVRECVDLYRE